MVSKALSRRIEAVEAAATTINAAPAGALPVIVEQDELNSPKSAFLRAQGYEVTTFERFAESVA